MSARLQLLCVLGRDTCDSGTISRGRIGTTRFWLYTIILLRQNAYIVGKAVLLDVSVAASVIPNNIIKGRHRTEGVALLCSR